MQHADLLFLFTPTVIVSVSFGTEHYLQKQITRWHILVWDWWVQWNILPKIKKQLKAKLERMFDFDASGKIISTPNSV